GYAHQDLTYLGKRAFLYYDRTLNEVTAFFKVGLLNCPSVVVNMDNSAAWLMDYSTYPGGEMTAGGWMFTPGSTSGNSVVLVGNTTGITAWESGVNTDGGSAIPVTMIWPANAFGNEQAWKSQEEMSALVNYIVAENGYNNNGNPSSETFYHRCWISDGGPLAIAESYQTYTVGLPSPFQGPF